MAGAGVCKEASGSLLFAHHCPSPDPAALPLHALSLHTAEGALNKHCQTTHTAPTVSHSQRLVLPCEIQLLRMASFCKIHDGSANVRVSNIEPSREEPGGTCQSDCEASGKRTYHGRAQGAGWAASPLTLCCCVCLPYRLASRLSVDKLPAVPSPAPSFSAQRDRGPKSINST